MTTTLWTVACAGSLIIGAVVGLIIAAVFSVNKDEYGEGFADGVRFNQFGGDQ